MYILYHPGLAARLPRPHYSCLHTVKCFGPETTTLLHLHKITNEPGFFYLLLAPYDFAAGQVKDVTWAIVRGGH